MQIPEQCLEGHMIVERNSIQVSVDFITCLSTVLYICHPILGNSDATLLHLTISYKRVC